jgi:tetratricopeptide (TPR) repeat protein
VAEHISRKDLKHDKFAEAVSHGVEEVASHQKQVWLIAAVVLVIVLAAAGWRFWSERQTVKAQAAFDEAMKTYQARIRVPGEAEEPGETTYVDEKNKFTDAVKKFEQVSKDYSLTKPGRLAKYYAGLSYANLGNHEEAQKWLRQVEGSSDEELAALGRFQLAHTMEALGKGEDAVNLYKALIAKPGTFVPKATAMLALADYYRKTNPAEAIKLYNQIKEEFKDSTVSQEAETRLQEMQAKT